LPRRRAGLPRRARRPRGLLLCCSLACQRSHHLADLRKLALPHAGAVDQLAVRVVGDDAVAPPLAEGTLGPPRSWGPGLGCGHGADGTAQVTSRTIIFLG